MNQQPPTIAYPAVHSYVLAGNEVLRPVYLAPPPPNSVILPADTSNVILHHNAQAQNTGSILNPMTWINGQLGVPQNSRTLVAPTQAVLVSGTPIPGHGEVSQVPHSGMVWATKSGYKTCCLGEILSCFTTKSVYDKFMLWKQCKKLSKKHIRSSPDKEALACLLIPFLRSLAHHRPEMRLEQGVCRAVEEWEQISSSERKVYYTMAEKFMQFEEEDAARIHQPQLPHIISAVSTGNNKAPVEKVDIPKKSTIACPHPSITQKKRDRPQPCEAPQEIPPEAPAQYRKNFDGVQNMKVVSKEVNKTDNVVETPDQELLQYIESLCDLQPCEASQEIPETLDPELLQYIESLCDLQPCEASQEIPETLDPELLQYIESLWDLQPCEAPQEIPETPDPELLQYIESLCDQPGFTSEQENIHSAFLRAILSSDTNLDLESLSEELEQDEMMEPPKAKKRILEY